MHIMRSILRRLWPEVADDEHIKRIRRNLAKMDRWRRGFQLFYGAMSIVVIGLFFGCLLLVQALAKMGGNIAPLGFVVGVSLGLSYAVALTHVAMGLFASLGSSRTERLMLRYHDALSELATRNTILFEQPQEEPVATP
jgi:hypothetical protein